MRELQNGSGSWSRRGKSRTPVGHRRHKGAPRHIPFLGIGTMEELPTKTTMNIAVGSQAHDGDLFNVHCISLWAQMKAQFPALIHTEVLKGDPIEGC